MALALREGISTDDVKKAISASGAILTHASQLLNVERRELVDYIETHKSVQKHIEETKDKCLDLAETMLMQLVKKGNFPALCFYLKCQGKDRGWIENGPVTSTAVQVNVSISKEEAMF
jgi:uncharacterized UPF0160 family protein